MASHFKTPEYSRIPIIAGNNISKNLSDAIFNKIREINKDISYACLLEDGVHFNNDFFNKNDSHYQNVKIILRNPETEFAVLRHSKNDIYDFGFLHEGADIVILDNAEFAEESMKNLLLENGILIVISDHQIEVTRKDEVLSSISFYNEEDKEILIMSTIEPLLKEIINLYE